MALESLPKISPANFSPDNDLIQVYSKKGDYVGVINPSYIKSSPSGVAGAIQFSDGSAFASSSNLTWNNATNALGLGSGTTSAFIDFASNPAGSTTTVGAIRTYVDGVNLSEVMTFREDGRLTIYNTLKSIFDNYSDLGTNSERFANVYALSGRFTNVSTNTLGPLGAATWINISSSVFSLVGGQLSVKGSGSTSATTSLLVQNSGGTNLLQMRDDGQLFIGTTASGLGKILVPHDSVYGDRAFLSIQGGTDLLSTRSNALLLINGGSFWAPDLQLTSLNAGLRGRTAVQTSNSSVLLSTEINAYNGTSQNDACNLVYIENRNATLQAGGSINWIKMDGVVNEAGGGGNKWCTGIYYNPSFTGGTLLANSHYCYHATSGQMMVNTTSPNASAQLQVDSTTRGFLPPRMTDAQVRAIATPAVGLMAYNTDLDCPVFYSAAGWRKVSHSVM